MSRTAYLPLVIPLSLALPALLSGACGSNSNSGTGFSGGGGSPSTSTASGANGGNNATSSGNPAGTGGSITFEGGLGDASDCAIHCSPDHHQVLDCNDVVQADCGDAGTLACDLTINGCAAPCVAAADNKQSVGCDFYATDMEANFSNACFAVYVANNWDAPVHITTVEFHANTPLPTPYKFAVIPSGTGTNVTYTPYDANTGIPPGQVAILFLSGATGAVSNESPVPCPVASAIPNGALVQGTGTGLSFHITTDLPVVAYQINPYGGGQAAVTGASLLLPTSVWDTNYVAVTAGTNPTADPNLGNPSINIISQTDGTMVTLLPTQDIVAGNGLPAGSKGVPYTFQLNAGLQAQFSQPTDLTGTVISATNPIGLMAGNACMQKPSGTDYCDHGEQMIPPVKSLGSEYVAVMWRARTTGDASIWRIVGALDGTTLSYEPSAPAGAPTSINAGELVEFTTADPFIVKAQDGSHPFMLFAQMSGATWSQLQTPGYGDPDFVLSVAPSQYLDNYVFMTDPTYPETNLVVVRAPDKTGKFQDVTLDCAGALTGWQTIGGYQWTTIDLMRHNFQGQNGCSTGAHSMSSSALFGLWVWGWGSPETQGGTCNSSASNFTCYVSYGYPGGMNVSPVNTVVIRTE